MAKRVWLGLWGTATATAIFGGALVMISCQAPPGPAEVERRGQALSLPDRGAKLSIDFEADPFGVPLTRGTVLAEQYAEWGVHFENSFLIGDQATDFTHYWHGSGNMVCTHEAGVDPMNPGACFGGQPAAGTPLVIDLDFDACEVGIEGLTPPETIPPFGPFPSVLGSVTMQAFNAAGTLESSGQVPVSPIVNCGGGCRLVDELPAFVVLPSSFPVSYPLPPPGFHFRRLVVTEDRVGALDNLGIFRCAGFVARCLSESSCAAPGQTVAPSVSINSGTEDPDGNPITFSQDPPGPFPVGTTTLVTLTANNGVTTSSCRASIFASDCTPPTVTCPPPMTTECVAADCTPFTPPSTAVASDDIPGPVTIRNPGVGCYGTGTSSIIYQATDAAGNTASCTTSLTVTDTTPPVVTVATGPSAADAAFSPPDGELHLVSLADCGVELINDTCQGPLAIEGSARITCVSSDEPASPGGRGCHDPRHHHPPATGPADIVLVDDTTVELRADRDPNGDGRVYTIAFEVFDASGNTTPGSCQVTVRRRERGPAAVDSHPHQTLCRQ